MFQNKYPLFDRGRILKSEMLENLRDFPRDFLDIYLQQYSNGIFQGCRVSANGAYLIVEPGILLYNGILYLLKEKVKIPYQSSSQIVLAKIKFFGEGRSKDFLSYSTQVYLDQKEEIQNDEMELCRFKLKEGARLRDNYTDLSDFSTEFDTINRIYVPFAAMGDATIFPEMLHYFAKEAMSYELTDTLDIVFCMECLKKEQIINKEMILSYLRIRYPSLQEQADNAQIHRAFINILNEIKTGKQGIRNQYGPERGILLD